MKDYNEEYFFLAWDGIANHPTLDFGDDQSEVPLFQPSPVDEDDIPFQLSLSEPMPKKPKMVDYHAFIFHHVVGEKLKSVLEQLSLKDTQFVPTEIEGRKKEVFKGYYIVHIYNRIKCVNMEASTYSKLTSGNIHLFDKLVLDNEVLDKIPLEDRLAFALEEKSVYKVFHISVVEKLLAEKPEGLTVYRLSKWNSSEPFKEEATNYLIERGSKK